MLYTRLLKSLFAFVFVLKVNIKIALNAASHSALLNIACAKARCYVHTVSQQHRLYEAADLVVCMRHCQHMLRERQTLCTANAVTA